MSDCCSPISLPPTSPKRRECVACGNACNAVSYATVLHHVTSPWKFNLAEQAYYFCDSPNCDIVYFGADNSEIRHNGLRTKVGIKSQDDDALICYCFGVSKAQAMSDADAKAFVVEQTKHSRCTCATSNPSGKCCLKDFPKNEGCCV